MSFCTRHHCRSPRCGAQGRFLAFPSPRAAVHSPRITCAIMIHSCLSASQLITLTPVVYIAKQWHPSQVRRFFLLVDSKNNSLAWIHTMHDKKKSPSSPHPPNITLHLLMENKIQSSFINLNIMLLHWITNVSLLLASSPPAEFSYR